MKRGQVWIVAGGSGYAGKPRPAIILQDDHFDQTSSMTVCPLTTDDLDVPLFRVRIEAATANGLRRTSRAMADKITTVAKSKIGQQVGQLSETDMVRVDEAVVVFLGLLRRPALR